MSAKRRPKIVGIERLDEETIGLCNDKDVIRTTVQRYIASDVV